MWIEIRRKQAALAVDAVILCARMWIEITTVGPKNNRLKVILCARMWIEIAFDQLPYLNF